MTSDGIAAAIKSTHVLCQIVIDHVLYDCCLTHQLETFLQKNYPSFTPPPVKNSPMMLPTAVNKQSIIPSIIPPSVVTPFPGSNNFASFARTSSVSSNSTPVDHPYYYSSSVSGSGLSTPSNHQNHPPHLVHHPHQVHHHQQQQPYTLGTDVSFMNNGSVNPSQTNPSRAHFNPSVFKHVNENTPNDFMTVIPPSSSSSSFMTKMESDPSSGYDFFFDK